jgi:ABC-2 type transport system permease protein
MLPIIFGMPIIQLLILSNAATYDIRNVRWHLIDKDQTTTSRLLSEKFTGSGYFILTNQSFSDLAGEKDLLRGKASMVLQIPHDFERDVMTTGTAKVQLSINAEDGSSAGLIQSYAGTIIATFAQELQVRLGNASTPLPMGIQIEYSNWYNRELNYKFYMVPGILVALVSMVGLFLSGMNIVREKELGTIEQLNVTPIKRYQFIIGKLLPFWIIGQFELALGLAVAKFVFHLPILGNLFLVFGLAGVYLLVVLGIGLFISTFTETQQQAMFIAWFFMVIFMLMGGIFTPIDSMPHWAQVITKFNPVAHFVDIMRRVLLKGAGFNDVLIPFSALLAFAIINLTFAVLRYRKVSE